MNNTLQAVHHEYDNVCVFSDFNCPSIDWSGNENTPNVGLCGSVSLKNGRFIGQLHQQPP